MAKVTLGVELLPSLDRIQPVLEMLTPVMQQQVLEVLMVTHLRRASALGSQRRILMDAFVKHVWQLVEQAETFDRTRG